MAHISFLGLGAMGARMAGHLVDAGHTLTVWNRDATKAQPLVARGAQVAANPRDAVQNAEFVISMVRDDAASRAVWLDAKTGALAAMPAQAVAIESSTLSREWAHTLAGEVAKQSKAFLDAPVIGSRPQAEGKQLIFTVGGDAATLARAEPIFKTMGAAVHHAGPQGAGATVKLLINALFGIQVAALAELLGALRDTELDPKTALDIIGATPVASTAAKGAGAGMLAQAFTPMFPIALVEKDFGYIEALGSARQQAMPMTQAARRVQREGIAAGLGEMNLTALAKLYG
jgi:3-hydroxyisobutyrate dehydrogenase